MKKVIKLTERDLMKIVKRVINEQSTLESKLRDRGFIDAQNTGGKKVLVKKTEKLGSFFFEFKNGGCVLNVLNPSNQTITTFKLKRKGKNKIGEWYTKGFLTEIDCERLAEYLDKLINYKPEDSTPEKQIVDTPFPMDEERFDFGSMSDEELHDLHPEVKGHPRHFKDFTPTSEYLGWRGEVDKRNLYKRHGKFHNAFDKEIED